MNNRRQFIRQGLLAVTGIAIAQGCEIEPDTLTGPAIRLLAPLGDEALITEQSYEIRWQALSVGSVEISFTFRALEDALWTVLATDVPAWQGRWTWTVPDREYVRCFIRVRAIGQPKVEDINIRPFTTQWRQVIRVADHAALLQEGGSKVFVSVQAGDFSVRRLAAGKYEALSLYCTHVGCTVEWQESDRMFVCPCHNSVFTEGGCLRAGPARGPLLSLASEYNPETGELTVYNRPQERPAC